MDYPYLRSTQVIAFGIRRESLGYDVCRGAATPQRISGKNLPLPARESVERSTTRASVEDARGWPFRGQSTFASLFRSSRKIETQALRLLSGWIVINSETDPSPGRRDTLPEMEELQAFGDRALDQFGSDLGTAFRPYPQTVPGHNRCQ